MGFCLQVRKTDAKGAQLPPGVVAVTGQKTALPPVQLVMGFGILFRVDVRSYPPLHFGVGTPSALPLTSEAL